MRLLPAGDAGVLAEVEDLAAVHRLLAAVRVADLPGVVDVVPGYRTLLVTVGSPLQLGAVREALSVLPLADGAAATGRLVEVAVTYDGEDLPAVCALTGLDAAEVVRRHSAVDYLVAFLGFTPGFPYLVGLDPALHVPRRDTPRTRVPAGSVGLAGSQTGVYPTASPGGWQLIGRTDAELFDPDRDPPALLAPGGPAAVRRVVIGVVDAGPLTTVQDRGRPGLAHLGVPQAGAADRRALDLANALVGNDPYAAALETTLTGPVLLVRVPAVLAVTGARCEVTVAGVPVPLDAPFAVAPGDEVRVGPATRGLRSYVGVRGGVDVAPVLGSRSTCTLSGLGPLPLRAGDRLPVGRATAGAVGLPTVVEAPAAVLPVVLGPRDDALTGRGLATLLSAEWTVTERSDRTGLRLSGPVLERAAGAEPLSEGLVAGSVQVPPDGQPVLFLAQHPTTGGYPVVAVVTDLSAAAQAAPGTRLRFSRRSPSPPYASCSPGRR